MKKIAVIGAGLLGGSLALAVRKNLPNTGVALWARREQPLKVAAEMGLTELFTDLGNCVEGADLVVLSTPVGVMAEIAQQIVDLRKGEAFTLTDVGSVKRLTHDTIEPIVEGTDVVYIGSHPMAGSESAGMESACENLLEDAACIITPGNNGGECELNKLLEFWQSLNMRVKQMSPEDHDYAVARISHFPHTLASIGAKVSLAFEDIADLAGGGLRDTTRVAAGDPKLWTEILLENRDALQRSMTECVGELNSVIEILKNNDEQEMFDYLTEAQRKRNLVK